MRETIAGLAQCTECNEPMTQSDQDELDRVQEKLKDRKPDVREEFLQDIQVAELVVIVLIFYKKFHRFHEYRFHKSESSCEWKPRHVSRTRTYLQALVSEHAETAMKLFGAAVLTLGEQMSINIRDDDLAGLFKEKRRTTYVN